MQLLEGELLQRGLSELGLQLSPAQQAALLAYLQLLSKWNRVYNLTAIRDNAAGLALHVLDSLSVLKPLRSHLNGVASPRVLDVGSGAGLPGVVLAVAEPGWSVTCVDAVGKKVSFIRQVAAELKLKNLHAEHARVESLSIPAVDVVTSRAFSSLSDFVTLTGRHLKAQACWVAMKGKRPDDEIAVLPSSVSVFHVEQLVVPGIDAERCLAWMRPRAAEV